MQHLRTFRLSVNKYSQERQLWRAYIGFFLKDNNNDIQHRVDGTDTTRWLAGMMEKNCGVSLIIGCFEEKISLVMNINTGLSPHFFGKCTKRGPIPSFFSVAEMCQCKTLPCC